LIDGLFFTIYVPVLVLGRHIQHYFSVVVVVVVVDVGWFRTIYPKIYACVPHFVVIFYTIFLLLFIYLFYLCNLGKCRPEYEKYMTDHRRKIDIGRAECERE
jgi:hypothetical protein